MLPFCCCVGAFRRYEFNVTPFVKVGGKNVVAVEVSAPHANELGITWVDWNPTPPDKDMADHSPAHADTVPYKVRRPHRPPER